MEILIVYVRNSLFFYTWVFLSLFQRIYPKKKTKNFVFQKMPPVLAFKTDAEVKAFVASVKLKMTANVTFNLAVTWSMKGKNQQTDQQEWISTKVRVSQEADDALNVMWAPPAKARTWYDFPNASCQYLDLQFQNEVQQMPGGEEIPEGVVEDHANLNEIPETNYVFHDIKTYSWYVERGRLGIEILIGKLRGDLRIEGTASGQRQRHFDDFVEWLWAAAESAEWEEGHFFALGQKLLQRCRDVLAAEEGRNVEAIHDELYAKVHPGDLYGAALAKVREKKKDEHPQNQKKRQLKCYACGKLGHIATKCRSSQADKDAYATTKPGFQARGSGTLPKKSN